MGVDKMLRREHQLLQRIFNRLKPISNLHILAERHENRLGVISFYIDDLHYNLGVKLLNDHFGVQTRGGCACAGTYGHYLLHIDRQTSKSITDIISKGDLSSKPGWIRLSIHPVLTNEEVHSALDAIESLANNFLSWQHNYQYNPITNEFESRLIDEHQTQSDRIDAWFDI